MMNRFILSLCCLVLVASTARGENFCDAKNLTHTEKIICGDPSLIWDDSLLNALYRLAREIAPSQKSTITSEQKQWLSKVRDLCKDKQCLDNAYQSRNTSLREYINAKADQMPDTSEWRMTFATKPDSCSEYYNKLKDNFSAAFVRTKSRKVIGVWEGTAWCTKFIHCGMIDVQEDGRIFDVRILGGRGPSHKVGVALLARKGNKLYVANMFDRTSCGCCGDFEFFKDVVLVGGPSNNETFDYDCASSANDLESAWHETEESALKENTCTPEQKLNVCIRRVRP